MSPQNQVRDTEEQGLWRVALQQAFDPIVQMDVRGHIVEWNPQAERCFGWFRHEVLGQALHEVIFPVTQHQNHLHWLARCLGGDVGLTLPHRVDMVGLHRTGTPLPLELSICRVDSPRGAEFIATLRDLTERKRAEESLRIAAAAFQSFEGMVIINAQKVILKVNQAFTQITGYSASEAVGKTSSIFRIEHHDETVFHELRRLLDVDRFWQGEVWDQRKSGDRYPAWLRVNAVIDANDQVSHYVIAFIDNTQHHRSEERIHYLAFYDPLTGLPNRRLLMDRLRKSLSGSVRKREHGAVLLIDLDNFKDINDTLGHETGDALLTQAANRLKGCLHSDDTMARVGGDEFVVVLEGLAADPTTAASKAELVADRLRNALTQPFDLANQSLQTACSIGIALYSGDSVAEDELIKHAESAMYRAKHAGRNCVRFFNTEQQSSLERRFALNTWMRKGLPEQFALHYQLQVDEGGGAVGVEALIRWKHPLQGNISPAMFIPLAEETGFVVQLGTWVLQTACEQLARWAHNPLTQKLTIAVNVSARQFHSAGFVKTVTDALEQTGADATLLKLELTEGLMLNDIVDVIEKMQSLKQTGVRFSIDDFGTGYSSLSYLKRLPLDQLKIDQSFVRDLLTDPNDMAIARTIIGLGHSLGLTVIAEGVETSDQRDILLHLGCDAFQGFYFGRPVEVALLEQSLAPTPVAPAPSSQPLLAEKT